MTPSKPKVATPGLEGMQDHAVGVVDAAGVLPPAAERLGQLSLAGPARPVDEDDSLEPAGQLQLVEQVVAADEPAHRGQRICTTAIVASTELVQGVV
jgi:hypothetical protein